MRAQTEQIRVDTARKERTMEQSTSAGPDFWTNDVVDSPVPETADCKKSNSKVSKLTETGDTPSRPRRILDGLSLLSSSNKERKALSRISSGANEERTYPPPPKSSGDSYASEAKVSVYDFDLYNLWKHKSDEEFLDDFTVEVIQGFSDHLLVRQLLHLVEAKHLLRDIPGRVLCLANKKSLAGQEELHQLESCSKANQTTSYQRNPGV